MHKTTISAATVCILLFGITTASAESMTLVGPNQPAPIIVIGEKPSEAEKYAAEELSVHLEMMTGTKIEIVDDTHLFTGNVRTIALGQNRLTADINVASLDSEQYIIDVRPRQLLIVGARQAAVPGQQTRDAATLYGVYHVLENLGVRWYRPELWGTHVPRMTTVKLEVGKIVSAKPSYLMRATMGGGMSYSREETRQETEQAWAWAVRNRINAGFCRPSDAVKFGHLVEHATGRHNWPDLVPAAKYFEEHPEYFALVDGQRVSYDLCPGNPEVQRIVAEKLIARAKENPYRSSISVEPSDARGGACQCELCRALDGPPNKRISGRVSNRVSGFGNEVAQTIAKQAPWLQVQWLAYSNHTAAPTNLTQLSPNTIIMLCPINGWDDWRHKLFDKTSRSNKMFVKMARQWTELKPDSLMTFLYFGGYGWPGPMPTVRTLADRMKGYRTLGIKGNYLPSVISWGPAGLSFYMYSRLCWNPDLNLEQELDLYYTNYYGPAAKPMKAYHERLMDALESHQYPIFSGGRGMHLLFTPALVKQLGSDMTQAQALVKDKPIYERRLYGVWAGYEFARRISEILVLKKKTGIISTKLPAGEKQELPPDLARPRFIGGGSYYQSDEAEEAYRDLVRWMHSVNKGDAVFDMKIKFKDDAAKYIYAKRSMDFGSGFFTYMANDVLIGVHQSIREEVLLKDF